MINQKILNEFIETEISVFHKKRIDKVKSLKLTNLLKRKNPYLFKAKNLLTAQDLVVSLLQAFLSSAEEAIFGEVLEKLAIYVNGIVYGGTKSAAEGIDLEFEKDQVRYIVSIKSGPNWGNSGQIAKMKDHFKKAKRILNTNTGNQHVVAVNGCCYSRDNKPDKGEYLKYCGEEFWEFISGEPDFYKSIIEPVGYKAKEKNDAFLKEYSLVVNSFTKIVLEDFCKETGEINWDKILELNSSKNRK